METVGMTLDWRDIPYSKGFVLTKHRLKNVAHYECQALPSDWYLWTDAAVPTDLATSHSNNFVIIRGHWVDTSEDTTSGSTAEQLLASLEARDELEFHRRIARLGGRFVLVVKLSSKILVYHDATGLRSVYYSLTAPLVASHLNLLVELLAEEPNYSYKDTILALDATPYSNIRQLLPNFRVDPEEGEAERFFPFEKNRYVSMTPEQRLTQVENIWQRVVNHYTSLTDKLALSITGGLDSKLMLAMCGNESIKFAAYTYGMTEKSDARSESLNFDIKQVQKMLPYMDVKSHEFLDITNPAAVPKSINNVIKANTWGSHGRYLVPLYRSLFTSDGWYHLRGNGVEIVRRFWPSSSTELSNLLQPISSGEGPPLVSRAEQLGYAQEQFGYNLTDLLYWEVRMGKWHAEILNEQDAAFETFLPISVRDTIELLLAFTEQEREHATAIYELINRNKPVLNFWGANDSRNLYEQWRDACDKDSEDTLNKTHHGNKLDEGQLLIEQVLSLSKGDFTAGNSVGARVTRNEKAGSLTFTIDQPYRKSSGEGYFEWQILVNGTARLRCDGAITMSPSTITLWNLPPGTDVSVALVAHKTVERDSNSWERASRLTVYDVRFFPGHVNGDGKLAVTSDNPYVERC